MGDAARIFARIAQALEHDNWLSTARPNQLPPEGDWWTVWLLCAGRGFGKSRAGAEYVRSMVGPGKRGVLRLSARPRATFAMS
jgi:phage terminase large subunit-like protein